MNPKDYGMTWEDVAEGRLDYIRRLEAQVKKAKEQLQFILDSGDFFFCESCELYVHNDEGCDDCCPSCGHHPDWEDRYADFCDSCKDDADDAVDMFYEVAHGRL